MVNDNFNPKVDNYIRSAAKWQEEMNQLRRIIIDCGLKEEVKWGKPCYTYEGKNIVLIQDFKKYFALLFFKGYLMKDSKSILIKTGENTIIGRQIRFTDTQEIISMEEVLKSYIYEAVEIEKADSIPQKE
jgi:uncharacterized protein YdeI (YjbR/CyaY-like superfamily)